MSIQKKIRFIIKKKNTAGVSESTVRQRIKINRIPRLLQTTRRAHDMNRQDRHGNQARPLAPAGKCTMCMVLPIRTRETVMGLVGVPREELTGCGEVDEERRGGVIPGCGE